jgi:hypothetical protein
MLIKRRWFFSVASVLDVFPRLESAGLMEKKGSFCSVWRFSVPVCERGACTCRRHFVAAAHVSSRSQAAAAAKLAERMHTYIHYI